MNVLRTALPHLKAAKGNVVNTSSISALRSAARQPPYGAIKAAVIHYTSTQAAMYARDGIRVNAVAPGWIATPLTQALQDDASRSQPILDRTPLKRWGQPEDIAQVVAFLCSPAAAFMTGTIVPVDGGYLIS